MSPLLANLFLHYVFDKWMDRHWPAHPFARYADDILANLHVPFTILFSNRSHD